MNKFQINSAFKAHLALIQGSYFRDYIRIRGATIVYGAVPSIIWNYAALIDSTPTAVPTLVDKACKILKSLGRDPAFYLEPSTEPYEKLTTYLSNLGFESTSAKWMFSTSDLKIEEKKPDGFNFVQVSDQKRMLDFLDVFNKAYEPINPEYGRALFSDFLNPSKKVQTMHFVGYIDKKPISISTYLSTVGYGGIYNVGTIPEYRKKGFATSLVKECINNSVENKDHMLFLQCEEELENYYHSLGFQTEFIGTVWYKQSS